MPRVAVQFYVEHKDTPAPPFASWINITNVKHFWDIVALGFPEERAVGKGQPFGHLCVECDEQDPRLSKVIALIAKSGYLPVERTLDRNDESRYLMNRHRTYDTSEIDASEFLRLRARKQIAEWKVTPCTEEEGWTIEVDAKLKTKRVFGHILHYDPLFVAEPLRTQLMEASLKGLGFLPVQYDRPKKAPKQLWQLFPDLPMPPCMLARVMDGRPVQFAIGNHPGPGQRWENRLIDWDDGTYYPPELQFWRAEVSKMGKFDIARTIEKIGCYPNIMYSSIIVSQRFRKVMQEAGIKDEVDVRYTPVRVVE